MGCHGMGSTAIAYGSDEVRGRVSELVVWISGRIYRGIATFDQGSRDRWRGEAKMNFVSMVKATNARDERGRQWAVRGS